MSQIPTLKIKADHPRGWAIINEAAFDPKKHVMYGAAPDKAAPFTPADDNAPLGYDSGEQFSDSDLRDAIKMASGKTPGPRTSREKLIEMFNGLNAAMAGA